MRNLSLTAELVTDISDSTVSRTAFDLDENVLYASSESYNADGDAEVKIWKLSDTNEVGPSMVGPRP